MVDSERTSIYEQCTGYNVASFIASDNTEASVQSPPNITLSQEQLRGKDKKNWLLVFDDGEKILDDFVVARKNWE